MALQEREQTFDRVVRVTRRLSGGEHAGLLGLALVKAIGRVRHPARGNGS